MRIISGEWRGRKLLAPKNDATRPTADRTRETLFSMLTSRVGSFEGLVVADLFAGSGALGLEALSRGAESCLFAEQDRDALDALKKNLTSLDAGKRAEVRAGSVMSLGPARRGYDIIFIDAPYDTGAGSVALDKLHRLGWVGAGTWVSIETAGTEEVNIRGFEMEAERKVGKAKLSLLRTIAAPADQVDQTDKAD